MIGKEKIKFVRSLHQKKFRQKYNKFIAEGPKIIGECIQDSSQRIDSIYGLPSYIQTLENHYEHLKKKLIEVNDIELKKISALETPNEAVAVLDMKAVGRDFNINDAVFLDGIQIPNNVGAILRIADWYGIPHVFISKSTADAFSPKVIQSSMGSFLRLHIESITLEELQQRCPEHSFMVADGGGESISSIEFPKPSILILGSEGRGPSEISLQKSNMTIGIPRVNGRKLPESLNVAVATGIICHIWKGSD